MDVGRMNKRVTLQSYQDQENELGQTIPALADYKTVWASVEPSGGKEYDVESRNRNQVSHNIVIRYLDGIHPDMIIKFKDRIFEIESIINYRERNEYLTIVCLEKIEGRKGTNG